VKDASNTQINTLKINKKLNFCPSNDIGAGTA
jgi:hypothetical protein